MRGLFPLGVRFAVAAVLASLLPGCGGVYYAVSVNAAHAKVEQARAMGAEQGAPYEYYYAREHLKEAQLHAAEASYGDAATYAETAETYAQKAIDLIQAAKRGQDPDRSSGDQGERGAGGSRGADKADKSSPSKPPVDDKQDSDSWGNQ